MYHPIENKNPPLNNVPPVQNPEILGVNNVPPISQKSRIWGVNNVPRQKRGVPCLIRDVVREAILLPKSIPMCPSISGEIQKLCSIFWCAKRAGKKWDLEPMTQYRTY